MYFFSQCETHNRQDKFLCCLCCKSGPITGMIRLDRCGFVPGEAIQFNAEIQNMTSRVCGIHVKLTMVRKNDFSFFFFWSFLRSLSTSNSTKIAFIIFSTRSAVHVILSTDINLFLASFLSFFKIKDRTYNCADHLTVSSTFLLNRIRYSMPPRNPRQQFRRSRGSPTPTSSPGRQTAGPGTVSSFRPSLRPFWWAVES